MPKKSNFKSIGKSMVCAIIFYCLLFESKAEQVVLPDELPECPVQRVMDAILSSTGVIWVVGEQSGIYTFDLKDPLNGKWVQVSTSGIFDASTNCYSIVEDLQGRIWIGTDNQGVMVYNGLVWMAYTVKNAILSNRVYNLAVSPFTGEVGIAGSAGVTIYNPNEQSWRDLTRGNGLTEDQVRALTFSEDGYVWFAYACGGLTKASLKHSVDSWQHIRAPWTWDKKGFARQPLVASGEGLPSNMCNNIISASGNVWAATCAGIAYSTTKGTAWKYVRGADYLEKNKGIYNPDNAIKWETKKNDNLLPQDHITVLAPAKQGLWVGTRDRGICRWSPQKGVIETPVLPDRHDKYEITTIISFPDGSIGYGTNGKGFGIVKSGSGKWEAGNSKISSIPKLPEIPPVPTEKQVLELLAQADQGREGKNGAYLGEDWMTKGDWPGRYGNVYALLCAAVDGEMNGRYLTGFVFGKRKKYINEAMGMYGILQDYKIGAYIGPHRSHGSEREWPLSIVYDDNSTNRNALIIPESLTRKESVWDDEGVDYPGTWDGPDLWVKIIVPEGVNFIDLYFYNTTDNRPESFKADFYIEMRQDPFATEDPQSAKEATDQDIAKLYSLPVLARARVSQFSGSGVYQKFTAVEQGTYWFRINKNNSSSARLNGIFISKLLPPLETDLEAIKKADNHFDKMLPLPPRLESEEIKGHLAFCELWNHVRKNAQSPLAQSTLRTGMLYQYRRLLRDEASKSLMERLAWDLGILTEKDYADFDVFTSKLKEERQKNNLKTEATQ